MEGPTSILCLAPLSSDRLLPLASSPAQLQRALVESKQHNTIREQRSTSINNIRSDVYWPHTNIYHKICKDMEENLNNFIDIKKNTGRITTNCSDPVSSSQQEALLHLMKSLDHSTLWCCSKKPTTLPYKIQNSSLWISGMWDPYIDVWKEGESAPGVWLVSSLW